MELHGRHRSPLLPDLRVLPQRAIATAWDVCEHPVEDAAALEQVRELLPLSAGADEVRTEDALALVNQHVRTIRVQKRAEVARSPQRPTAVRRKGAVGVEHLEHLGRLGPRRGAKVQHLVVATDVQHQRRHHADHFLAGHASGLAVLHEPAVQALQREVLAQFAPVKGHLEGAAGEPVHAGHHLHFLAVLQRQARARVVPQLLLQLVTVRAELVDAESRGQGPRHRGHERVPLVLGHHAHSLVVHLEVGAAVHPLTPVPCRPEARVRQRIIFDPQAKYPPHLYHSRCYRRHACDFDPGGLACRSGLAYYPSRHLRDRLRRATCASSGPFAPVESTRQEEAGPPAHGCAL
eukprot:scaffold803_cov310-Pinguiococcus_pyrenoidosus.AAC.173